MTEKRKDLDTRKKFDKVLSDLTMILSCYDKIYHHDKATQYLKTYKLFEDSDTIKGRLFKKLGII